MRRPLAAVIPSSSSSVKHRDPRSSVEDTATERPEPGACHCFQSQMTNYFLAQQKLISKVRNGAKVTKKYDIPTTPHRRSERHKTVSTQDKAIMKDTFAELNPAAINARSRP